MDGPTVVAGLEKALSTDNGWLEASTIAVFAGVVIELADLLFFNKEMGRLQRRVLFAASALVIAGCGGEWYFEQQATQVEGRLQRDADERVGALAAAEARDNRVAKQAAAQAGNLGVTVGNLTQTVETQTDRAKSLIARANNASAATAAALTAERAARAKVLAAITPRDLTPQQSQRIVDRIRLFAGTPFNLAMQTELEPMRFLDKIERAILSAGWKEIPPDRRGPSFDRENESVVGIRSMAGVWVLSAPEFEKPRQALVMALRAEGIVTAEHAITGSDSEDHRGVAVWVGEKP